MVDDVKDITENAETKVSAEALDRARLARERREAEQRKRLDELRAHAAAAQAQREKRDEDRRRRQAEQRAKDDDRRQQVEERKRAIWEASVSRREALLQRERDRTERLERARAARSAPRPAFAFGSSTPRLLEPIDSAGFFWAARRAASTTNVMFASAPLTRRASALQLDSSDTDNKDEPDRSPQPQAWSSVARRRTDLVPTLPAPRAPGRAYSMTRLDRIPAARPIHSNSPSLHQLNRSQTRSGDTTPGSRPGSAMSNATGVVRRASSAPRKPRPASIAGTGVNTPRGGVDTGASSVASTPSVSRDGTTVATEAPRRAATTPRRPRPLSLHATARPCTFLSFEWRAPSDGTRHGNGTGHAPPLAPGEGKPPPHRKPKPSKDHDKTPRGKSLSASPGRALSPAHGKDVSGDKDGIHKVSMSSSVTDKSSVSAAEVSQKLEALQIDSGDDHDKVSENKENIDINQETKHEDKQPEMIEEKPIELQKPVEKVEKIEKVEKKEEKIEKVEKKEEKVEKREEKLEKKEPSQEKTDENEMTASMLGRRITTEEEAKAALAERRRRAREELERQAEKERQRLQREAEEEAERQRQEEERQRREEEEARELAALQRRVEEEKLRKAIEAQQQLELEEAERRVREEEERAARARDEEERRRAADHAERLRREEAEREERERLARKQRVEAIMARTRLKKQAEEDKKKQESQSQAAAPAPSAAAPAADNGNGNEVVGDLVQLDASQPEESKPAEEPSVKPIVEPSAEPSIEPSAEPSVTPNNGNVTADLLGLSETNNSEDKTGEQTSTTKQNDNANTNNTQQQVQQIIETNNGNVRDALPTGVGHISANFIQTERLSAEHQTKMADKLLEDDFTTHNGHGTINHPLTLQNAI